MKIFWFIPTHGDSRYLGTSKGARQLNHDYLKQVAVAADSLGYEGVLIPDHVPHSALDTPYGHRAHAFAYGYIRGLIQATEPSA